MKNALNKFKLRFQVVFVVILDSVAFKYQIKTFAVTHYLNIEKSYWREYILFVFQEYNRLYRIRSWEELVRQTACLNVDLQERTLKYCF